MLRRLTKLFDLSVSIGFEALHVLHRLLTTQAFSTTDYPSLLNNRLRKELGMRHPDDDPLEVLNAVRQQRRYTLLLDFSICSVLGTVQQALCDLMCGVEFWSLPGLSAMSQNILPFTAAVDEACACALSPHVP